MRHRAALVGCACRSRASRCVMDLAGGAPLKWGKLGDVQRLGPRGDHWLSAFRLPPFRLSAFPPSGTFRACTSPCSAPAPWAPTSAAAWLRRARTSRSSPGARPCGCSVPRASASPAPNATSPSSPSPPPTPPPSSAPPTSSSSASRPGRSPTPPAPWARSSAPAPSSSPSERRRRPRPAGRRPRPRARARGPLPHPRLDRPPRRDPPRGRRALHRLRELAGGLSPRAGRLKAAFARPRRHRRGARGRPGRAVAQVSVHRLGQRARRRHPRPPSACSGPGPRLLQAAFSYYGFSADWDGQRHAGAFSSVLSHRQIRPFDDLLCAGLCADSSKGDAT
jgi:hypothetical protein